MNLVRANIVKSRGFFKNTLQDTCYIEKKYIYENITLTISSTSLQSSIADVSLLHIDQSTVFQIPDAEIIFRYFPSLTSLAISDSKLSRITKEDLRGYQCLKELYVGLNEIEYLPENLFENTPNLECISFANNKIKFIDPEILNPLKNLKIFDLSENSNIDVRLDLISIYNGNVTVETLKSEINRRCGRGSEMMKKIEAQEKHINELTKKLNELNIKLEEKALEASKNLTVIVAEKEFKIHRSILSSFSPVFERMMRENPTANSITLQDISEDSFGHIINFMYTGNIQSHDANLMEIFAAACQLEVNVLCAIASTMLKDKITPENSYNILLLCNKHKKFDLLPKAFEEFSKNFPSQKLPFDLAKQPEKLKRLIRAKLEIEEVVAANELE